MKAKEAKVIYQKGRFRVFRTWTGCYALQVKLFPSPGVGSTEDWVTIELYDYFSNAQARAKKMHEIMDGNPEFKK